MKTTSQLKSAISQKTERKCMKQHTHNNIKWRRYIFALPSAVLVLASLGELTAQEPQKRELPPVMPSTSKTRAALQAKAAELLREMPTEDAIQQKQLDSADASLARSVRALLEDTAAHAAQWKDSDVIEHRLQLEGLFESYLLEKCAGTRAGANLIFDCLAGCRNGSRNCYRGCGRGAPDEIADCNWDCYLGTVMCKLSCFGIVPAPSR
jgi:hypothetical protein